MNSLKKITFAIVCYSLNFFSLHAMEEKELPEITCLISPSDVLSAKDVNEVLSNLFENSKIERRPSLVDKPCFKLKPVQGFNYFFDLTDIVKSFFLAGKKNKSYEIYCEIESSKNLPEKNLENVLIELEAHKIITRVPTVNNKILLALERTQKNYLTKIAECFFIEGRNYQLDIHLVNEKLKPKIACYSIKQMLGMLGLGVCFGTAITLALLKFKH